jgi:hypothetical protein
MADEIKDQEQKNKLIQEENQLLEKRIKLQADSLDQSYSLVESLKETLGIRTKNTAFDQSLLKINKDITKSIQDQKTGLSTVAEVNKQIKKNKELIAKTITKETQLSESLGDKDKNRVRYAIDREKSLVKQTARLAQIELLSDKEREASKGEVKELNKKIAANKQYIDTTFENLGTSGKQLFITQRQRMEIEKQNEEREKEKKTLEAIEENLGVSGALLDGISKIPGFKGIADSLDKVRTKLKDTVEEGGELPDKFTTFGMILKQTGKDIAKNLTDPLVVSTFIIDQVVSVFKRLDTLTSGTARNFGISNDEANDLNKELTEVATTQEGFFGTTSNLNAAFQEINNRYGTFAKLNGENLKTFTRLTKEAGISGEALGELQDTTFLAGKTLEEQTVEYKGQVKILKATTGLALNEKQILEGIKDVSAATKLTLGGSAEAIATAVFKAKALGLEMKDLATISNSLLNFQSSIEDELSAELLTGKQLNLERARAAALADDQATLAEELANNFGTAAEFGKMNVIQQTAAAKAIGLSRDALAESLMKREAMAKLAQFEGDTEKQKYENAVKTLGVEGARKQLGNEALADQMESVSLQEKIAAATQKFQEPLVKMAEEIMPKISALFEFIGNNINGIITAIKIIIPLMVAYKAATIATSVAQIAGASAISGGAAGIAALVAGGAAFAFLNSIGDGVFPANGKAVISPKEGGLFQVSDNDDIVVAPKLAQAVGGGGGTSQNIQNKVDISPSNTQVTLNLNGQAIGNANARQNYGVGKSIRALGGNVDYSASV